MRSALVLPAFVVLGLAACGPGPQGAGFTGIGSEPATLTAPQPGQISVNTGLGADRSGAEVAAASGLPLLQMQGAGRPAPVLAQVAMAAGGKTSKTANSVEVAGHQMMLSLVEAEDDLFLVARAPKSATGRTLAPGADRAFLASVSAVTGCSSERGVYRYGAAQTLPEGLAVVLHCS